jgi:hypothetical protein
MAHDAYHRADDHPYRVACTIDALTAHRYRARLESHERQAPDAVVC